MDTRIKMEIETKEIINAIKKMKKEDGDAFIEDLLASTSPEYLNSIKEARADYKAGRVAERKELFGSSRVVFNIVGNEIK